MPVLSCEPTFCLTNRDVGSSIGTYGLFGKKSAQVLDRRLNAPLPSLPRGYFAGFAQSPIVIVRGLDHAAKN